MSLRVGQEAPNFSATAVYDQEFKEWSEDPIPDKELIWTLPDLTSVNRFKNFCRQIKKEIY